MITGLRGGARKTVESWGIQNPKVALRHGLQGFGLNTMEGKLPNSPWIWDEGLEYLNQKGRKDRLLFLSRKKSPRKPGPVG